MKHTQSSLLRRALAIALCGIGMATMVHTAHAADQKKDGRYVLITHAPDSDAWWNTVKNALKQAAEDFNVDVDYRNPPNGDLADMSRQIEQSAARGYDGVVATIADYDILKSSIGKVTAKKIPLVTIDSGTTEQSEALGALMHVGQPDYEAGKGAGLRAKADGIKSFVCVNHQATNESLMDRCKGFADAIGANLSKSLLDTGGDPVTVESKVSAYLRNNPGTQAILTLGPDGADPTIRALEKMGKYGKVWMATFDITPDIIKAVKKGGIKFTIDSQPYLLGYVPVALMAIMKRDHITEVAKAVEVLKKDPKYQARLKAYGLVPVYGPRHINCGPGFLTKDAVATVEKYAGQYR